MTYSERTDHDACRADAFEQVRVINAVLYDMDDWEPSWWHLLDRFQRWYWIRKLRDASEQTGLIRRLVNEGTLHSYDH